MAISWFLSAFPGKWWDSTFRKSTTASFKKHFQLLFHNHSVGNKSIIQYNEHESTKSVPCDKYEYKSLPQMSHNNLFQSKGAKYKFRWTNTTWGGILPLNGILNCSSYKNNSRLWQSLWKQVWYLNASLSLSLSLSHARAHTHSLSLSCILTFLRFIIILSPCTWSHKITNLCWSPPSAICSHTLLFQFLTQPKKIIANPDPLPLYLCLGLPNSLFSLGFSAKTLYTHLPSSTCMTYAPTILSSS